jgi:tripartite-type tricarboxylate transporter receptor subunit TctC
MNPRESAAVFFFACAATAHSTGAAAQSYPSKPVRMLSVFTAGSSGDFSCRLLATGLTGLMGQPVVVENLPGAGGVLAAQRVVQAAPDGYMLLYSHSGVVISLVHLSRNKPFDPVKDFTPISKVSESVTYLVTSNSLAPNNVKDFISYAKANPGKIPYGSAGIGSPTHVVAEVFSIAAGLDLIHVPYKGVNLALQDIVAGTLASGFIISPTIPQSARAGKIKVLAAMGNARSPLLPEVPTVKELMPAYDPPPVWTGLLGPAHIPVALAARLHADTVKVMESPEARAKLAETDTIITMSASPGEFAARIQRESTMIAEIVKRAKIPLSD